jgi:putative Mg2+ transporter-C (MgtC) family protein
MNQTLTEFDIVLRLCLAFIAGGIIGFERSSRRQVAGLRTHILITVGAACLMLLSIWIPQNFFSANSDPTRIAAQVVSGMGFLGAGAIIRLGNNTKGLTTAASLWLVSAVGMTIGAGMFIAALAAVVLALIALVILNYVERIIFPDVRSKLIELHYTHCDEPDTEAILEIFKKFGIENQNVNINQDQEKKTNTRVIFNINILDTVNIFKLTKAIKSLGDIEYIEIKENF